MSKCSNKSKVELPKTCVRSTEKKETPPAPDILDPNVEAEASEVRGEEEQEKND